MMRPLIALLGVGAACAACCAIPLALPLLGGLAMSGALGMLTGWQWTLGAALLTAALASGWYLFRRRRACKIDPAGQQPLACECGATGTSNRTGCGGAR